MADDKEGTVRRSLSEDELAEMRAEVKRASQRPADPAEINDLGRSLANSHLLIIELLNDALKEYEKGKDPS